MPPWKDVADLKKSAAKSKFFEKARVELVEQVGLTSLRFRCLNPEYNFKDLVVEALVGTHFTKFSFVCAEYYERRVAAYKPVTSHLRAFQPKGFLFGPVDHPNAQNVDALLNLLFHVAKHQLDPLSKKLRKDEQVQRILLRGWRDWDSLDHLYEGELFPLVVEPVKGEATNIFVSCGPRLKCAKAAFWLAKNVRRVLGSVKKNGGAEN